jgi:hypothetical protein
VVDVELGEVELVVDDEVGVVKVELLEAVVELEDGDSTVVPLVV